MSLRLLASSVLLLALQALVPANTARTLRDRYGQPISETFLIRPGVVASATYAASGNVCEIVVSPQRLWNSTLESRQINEITDELIPPGERGKVATGGFINGSCPTNDCGGADYEWQKVSIIRWGTNDQIHYASIRWRRDECRP